MTGYDCSLSAYNSSAGTVVIEQMVHCKGGDPKPHICKWIDRRVVLYFSTTNKQAEGKMSTQVLVIEILRLKFEIMRL